MRVEYGVGLKGERVLKDGRCMLGEVGGMDSDLAVVEAGIGREGKRMEKVHQDHITAI